MSDPHESPSMAMPDLPMELFDDDEPLYAPLTPMEDDSEVWEGEVFSDTPSGRPVHLADAGYDDYIDERPRPRPRRATASAPGRRPSPRDDASFDEVEGRPARRPRRVAPAGEIRTGMPRQDRLSARSQPADDEWNVPAADVEIPRRRRNAPQPARRPSRQDRVIEQPRMRTESITADIVTSVQPSFKPVAARSRTRRPRNPAWQWTPIVMPQPRQMVEQALPSLLMALSLFGTLAILNFLPGGLPLWAPLVLIPTALLFFRADRKVHPMWARSAVINLVVVGAFFPMMIVRQSFLRVPFVELGNGTLVMPILSTVLVMVAMVAIALGSAFLTQDDPEYAGMLFLPAALLVPFFAGATEITGLRSALAITGTIYIACAVLTVVASMLPAAFPTLVAPIALALEFFVLPISESTPIFPVGAGMSAKLLFFAVLAMGVGLTVAVPMLAVWVRQVRRIVGESLHVGQNQGATA